MRKESWREGWGCPSPEWGMLLSRAKQSRSQIIIRSKLSYLFSYDRPSTVPPTISSPQRPDDNSPLKGAKGIYILHRSQNPIYVGIATTGENPIAKRLKDHAKDWLAPWWDSVCWYDFGDNIQEAEIVESLMISHGVGLWNGAESGGKHFGQQFFIEGRNNASSDLWKK